MKQIVLIVTSMLFVVTAAMAQPQRGPQGPRGSHMMPQHRGPRAAMKLVKLTNEEVAAKFARTLRLDEEKAEAFTPVFEAFLASKAEVDTQYPVQPRRMAFRPMHKEQPTEAQVAEMKAVHKEMMAKHKATFALHKEYRQQFLDVLNGRQYHRMMGLINDQRMYEKLVRITPKTDEDKTNTDEEQQVNARGTDGIASSIGAVTGNTSDSEWYSINCVRQNGQPSQTGVYVRNGKKVLIK